MKKLLIPFLTLLLLFPASAKADGEGGVVTVYDARGGVLCTLACAVDVGDEYIAADNARYRIESVDEHAGTARAVFEGIETLPGVDWLSASAVIAVSSGSGGGNRLIALYATHSDESYEPTDGTESKEDGDGGIYDVANAFKEALEAEGVTAVLDDTSHVPHDAGAYRRSRQTAINLMRENAPDALIDIHRDGIPDADEYEAEIAGEAASRVRLLVGRSNQNADANRAFALSIKAVADEKYPGLIKDIFVGKGTYNQDLMSNAILLEFGTHTLDKERAIASAQLMGGVVAGAVYGDVRGAAGGGQEQESRGAGTGIIWVIVAVVIAIGAFAILQTGRGKAALEKIKRGASEITAGLIGKKPKR